MERTGARAALDGWLDWRRSELFIEGYAERRQPAQSQVLSPNDRAWFQSQIRSAPRERCKSKLPFDTGQRRAKAEVTGPTKCQMPIVRAPKIEPIRIGKSFGIAIAGAHHRDHGLALANLFAAEFRVLWTDASGVLARTFIAQQFFHRRRNQRQIVAQPLQ